MRIGIVGFASSGKSTLFQLLTGAKPDHSVGRSGQLGVAEIPDPRLGVLAAMYRPAKVTAATAEFLDTPGLDPREGGDNPAVLGLMRQVDALLIVLGPYLGAEPADELRRLGDELAFADLALVTGRMEKLEAGLKKPRPELEREAQAAELAALGKLARQLEAAGQAPPLGAADRAAFRAYQLFIDKPRAVVINQAESALGEPLPTLAGGPPQALSARLELELSQLPADERAGFMKELGLESLARDAIINALTRGALGQITFFTVGEDEVRGWPLQAGSSAVNAAGKIHTDLARGFIRGEVIHYDDLIRCGSEKEAKRQGLYRLEGKDYVVRDGDILHVVSGLAQKKR